MKKVEEQKMTESKEKVLASATQLEMDGRQFYLDLAENAPNPLAEKMFTSLAEDEKKHLQWLEMINNGERPEVSSIGDTYARLQKIFADAPSIVRENAKSSKDDTEALQTALQFEKKSIDAYREWASNADDEEVRKLCEKLVDFEKGHWDIITSTIRYLDETGNWFMEEENWIFDGGAA